MLFWNSGLDLNIECFIVKNEIIKQSGQLKAVRGHFDDFKIEAINIEYGKIENCKIDTILTSKILRLVTSKR